MISSCSAAGDGGNGSIRDANICYIYTYATFIDIRCKPIGLMVQKSLRVFAAGALNGVKGGRGEHWWFPIIEIDCVYIGCSWYIYIYANTSDIRPANMQRNNIVRAKYPAVINFHDRIY